MRLWHISLIKNDLLPKSQSLSQWRELCAIYGKPINHILINYVKDYDRQVLYNYSIEVLKMLERQNIKVRLSKAFNDYFAGIESTTNEMFAEHDFVYLEMNYFNLKEKFIRSQRDFNDKLFKRLTKFYQEEKRKNARNSIKRHN